MRLSLGLLLLCAASLFAGENVSGLAAGGYHFVGINASGQVLGAGEHEHGQLGDIPGTSIVEGLSNIVALSAGHFHTLALDGNGAVWCTGDWSFAIPSPHGTRAPTLAPERMAGMSNITRIVSGARHHLALDGDGRLWSGGQNGAGQVGNGSRVPVTVPVVVLTNVAAMAGGARHSVAVRADGSLWAWGGNGSGQLGLGHTTNSAVPMAVVGVGNAVECAAGEEHTLVRLMDGTVLAFGLNAYGQLGDGMTDMRTSPVVVSGLSNIVSLSAGASHSAARDGVGRAYLWGRNLEGQCGGGPASPSFHTTPREAAEVGLVDTLVCGRHFTVYRDAGTHFTYGMGSSSDGQLRSAATADAGNHPRYHTPVLIAELSATAAPPVLSISGTVSGATGGRSLPLFLLESNAVIATALPATDGTYFFEALLPGSYDVRAKPPVNHIVTPTNQSVILSNQDVSGIDFSLVPPPFVEPELLALYSLDETDGAEAFDASRVTGNGAVTGTYVWQPDGGVLEGALQIGNGRILIPDQDVAGGITGALWVKFSDVTAQQMLVAQGDPFEVQLQMRGDGGGHLFRIRVNLSGGASLITDSITQAVINTWHHVVFRYDGNNLCLFVDGVEESQVSGSGVLTDLNVTWSIGARNNGSFPTSGCLDEVRLYDGALGDEQIQALANPRAFSNGGFESPEMGTGSGAYAPTPSGWLWTGSSEGAGRANSGITANGTAFTDGNPPAPEGDQVAYLQREAVLEQVIHLPPGGYQIQFQAAQRGNVGFGSQSFETYMGTNLIGSFTPPDTDYTVQQTQVLYVPGGFHAFGIRGVNPGGGDSTSFLDDFHVLVSAQPGFWGWQALSHGGTTIESDLDGDGHGDLMEYALGGDPNDPGTPGGIRALLGPGDVTVQFTRPVGLPDISYHLLVCEILSPPGWNELRVTPTVFNLGDGTERVDFENLRQATGFSQSLFCRLEVRLL